MPGLRGWLGQALGGTKRTPEFSGYVANFGVGTNTWVCPKTGRYRVVQWGGGGCRGANSGGDGAAHAQTVRWLTTGQSLSITVGEVFEGIEGGAATVLFPDSTLVTTTGGASGNGTSRPGVATGGDVNVPGRPRSGLFGGSAGSYGQFIGGAGGVAAFGFQSGGNPGGGAYDRGAAGASGGPALVLIIYEGSA